MLRFVAAGVLALALLPATAGAQRSVRRSPITRSPLLWATVNVCGPSRFPHTLGLRASIPGDGARRERMWLRFRVQYRGRDDRRWHEVGAGGDSGWIGAGSADVAAREAGERFRFLPASDGRATRMRGKVTFEWRRGARVVRSLERLTTAGHRSGAGADPPRYSAATCLLR